MWGQTWPSGLCVLGAGAARTRLSALGLSLHCLWSGWVITGGMG